MRKKGGKESGTVGVPFLFWTCFQKITSERGIKPLYMIDKIILTFASGDYFFWTNKI